MTAFSTAVEWLGRLPLGRRAPARLEEDGRVLHLFRNRAELKKAHGELQDEVHRLRDRIKQQEGATARVQDLMEELEARLADPASGFTTLVFYQLRDLWNSGRELIAQMIGELASQQEDRERRAFLAEFNREQFDRRQRTEAELRGAETQAADVRGRLAGLNAQRSRASRWWHYFRRRELDRRVHAMGAELAAANAVLDAARAAHEDVMGQQPPEFTGLSMDARRAINLAGIAYAELLCLRLARTPLVTLAREASRRREPRDPYGDQRACLALMADIERAKLTLRNRSQVAQEVRVRSDRLRAQARYRSPADAVPTEDSLGAAREASDRPDGLPAVLRDDLWDLNRVLLR